MKRSRSTWVLGLALLAALALAVVTQRPSNGTPLDPDNPGPDGARALARVLDDQGVEVETARTADELDAITMDGATTVVVVLPEYLGRSTADRLLAHTAPSREVVVLGLGPSSQRLLGDRAALERVDLGEGREAECDDPLVAGLSIEVDQAYEYAGGACFPGDTGGVLRSVQPGLRFFGADEAFTNRSITRADNAAVALRMLGQSERLVWYVPTLVDLQAGEAVTASSLLPRWLYPGLWVGSLAAVALIVWRARRLGPLAVEPLPVVVRASETTDSLGRLYRRAGDRAHAADALRSAARRRLADRLGLSSTIPDDVLVRHVAERCERDEHELARLLGRTGHPEPPPNDQGLVGLARELHELDREVRRT